jgi:methionyl-tRNA formyltransferase
LRTLLIGGTDLTVAIAEKLTGIGHKPCACVGIGSQFKISYSKAPIQNARHGDVGFWSHRNETPYLESADSKEIEAFAGETGADFCLVAGWYHLVPKWLRQRFPFGAAAVHASLLPQLRGGAPLNWAILSGLTATGVTMFSLGDGVDDGPVFGRARFEVAPRATIGGLIRQAEEATLQVLGEFIPAIASGAVIARPQEGIPTYGMQRVPDDGLIDWRCSAELIDRLVRAVGRPYPGATTFLAETAIKIWAARPEGMPRVWGAPGQIARLPEFPEPCALTGNGLLVIEEATLADGDDAIPLLKSSNNKRFT